MIEDIIFIPTTKCYKKFCTLYHIFYGATYNRKMYYFTHDWSLFSEQGQALLDLRSWGPTTGEARCGLLGHLLADQSHSLVALPIRDVGCQGVTVTCAVRAETSRPRRVRRERGSLRCLQALVEVLSLHALRSRQQPPAVAVA